MCVICDDTEPSIGGIFLHNPSQRHLRGGSHSIGFVENYEFEGANCGCFARFWQSSEDLFSTCNISVPTAQPDRW